MGDMAQAGTLMHELGHNLGLRHGGDDHTKYKPNYLSVMNYAFQLTGLLQADLTRRPAWTTRASPSGWTRRRSTRPRASASRRGRRQPAFLTLGRCPERRADGMASARSARRLQLRRRGGRRGLRRHERRRRSDRVQRPRGLAWPPVQGWRDRCGRRRRTGRRDARDRAAAGGAAREPGRPRGLHAVQATVDAGPGPRPARAGPGAGATTPPALSGLRLRPRTFRRGRTTTIAYALSGPGTVRFTVERLRPGRRRARALRRARARAARSAVHAPHAAGRQPGGHRRDRRERVALQGPARRETPASRAATACAQRRWHPTARPARPSTRPSASSAEDSRYAVRCSAAGTLSMAGCASRGCDAHQRT